MLRAVLDPGVLISAVISPRAAPAALVRVWRANRFELVVSPALLDELMTVLLRSKFRRYLTEDQASSLVIELETAGTKTDDPDDRPAVTADPDDDYLVALAIAAQADALISGDRHLTALVKPAVPVLTPRAFLNQLTPQTGR